MNRTNFTDSSKNNKSIASIIEAAKRKWQTADNFYRERDNRTALEIKNLEFYAVQPIEIWLDPLHSDSPALQEIMLLICNLTARWARNIVVRFSADTALTANLRRDGFELLTERILYEMKTADPFSDFSVLDYDAQNDRKTLRIFIGSWSDISAVEPVITPEDYFIDASGWSVFGKRGSSFGLYVQENTSVPTTALSAALGAADLFKRAVGHTRDEWMPDNFVWNVWEQKFSDDEFAVYAARKRKNIKYPIMRDLDLGRTLLAGVGAIGSALVYLIDFMNLTGEMVFLDRDRVETSNLNRSPLFNILHELGNWEKIRIGADYLNRHNIKISERLGTWQEYAAQIAREPFDQWISLTNEDGAWAIVPFLLPPVILHGTTTSGWGFGAGRHLPRREDCTLCRMPRPETKFRGLCAQGEIPNNEVATKSVATASASLPFLSAASAALLLAEIIKLGVSVNNSQLAREISESGNEISADLRFGLFTVMHLKRLSNKTCHGCRASITQKWLELGGRSRYRFLSDVDRKLHSDLGLKAA